jgi:hypothetical protein
MDEQAKQILAIAPILPGQKADERYFIKRRNTQSSAVSNPPEHHESTPVEPTSQPAQDEPPTPVPESTDPSARPPNLLHAPLKDGHLSSGGPPTVQRTDSQASGEVDEFHDALS